MKRTPVVLYLDTDPEHAIQGATDRHGVATFDILPASGKIVINGSTGYHGRLDGDVEITLWSPTDATTVAEQGTPGGRETGRPACSGSTTTKSTVKAIGSISVTGQRHSCAPRPLRRD